VLRGLGLDKHWVRRRVACGLLHRVHRGVYSVGTPAISLRGRYLAAVMACGRDAALSHRSAAHLWGIRPNATRLEVTVARGRVGPAGVDRAERLGIFDLASVIEVLARVTGRRGCSALRRAIAAWDPSRSRSELERRFRELLRAAADVPRPAFNALVEGEIVVHEVDALWSRDRLAVQLDGFEFHRTRRDRERDAATDADLELAGYRVMRLSWEHVTVHGDRTLRRVRLARPQRVWSA